MVVLHRPDQTGQTEAGPGRAAPAEPAQSWSIAEAKARLSELLHQVESVGPQALTRRGEPVAVIVSWQEWHHKTARKGTLAEFFAGSPLAGSGLDLSRDQDEPRAVDL